MRHYYADVPRLGNVALSRHAQERAAEEAITDHHVAEALRNGTLSPDGPATRLEHKGVRLILIRPEPFRGALLVRTLYRVQRQASVRHK